jgi:hypothetical protein
MFSNVDFRFHILTVEHFKNFRSKIADFDLGEKVTPMA